jgi:hypothetical protein
MTAMEETGTLQALSFLGRAGRANFPRVLVLRTASNYSMQPPGSERPRACGGKRWANIPVTARRSKPPIGSAAAWLMN